MAIVPKSTGPAIVKHCCSRATRSWIHQARQVVSWKRLSRQPRRWKSLKRRVDPPTNESTGIVFSGACKSKRPQVATHHQCQHRMLNKKISTRWQGIWIVSTCACLSPNFTHLRASLRTRHKPHYTEDQSIIRRQSVPLRTHSESWQTWRRDSKPT